MHSWTSFNHPGPMGHSHRSFSTFTKPTDNMHKMQAEPQNQHNWQDITQRFLNIPHTKKFSNPNFVHTQNQSHKEVQTHGILYEKCSVFINESNGYPNNPPKTHLEQSNGYPNNSAKTNFEHSNGYPNNSTKNHFEHSNGYPNNPPKTHIEQSPPMKTAPMDIVLKETRNKSPNRKKYYKKQKTRKCWHKQNLNMDLIEDVDEIGTDVCNDPNYLNPTNCDTSVALGVIEHSPWRTATLGEFIRNPSPRKITEEIILTLPNSPICIKISTPVYFSISPPKPPVGHRRIPSDCVSEDSFVVFDEGDPDSSSSEEEDEYDETESDCSGDESDFIDFNDNSCKNTPKTDVEDIPITTKKVRFAEGKKLVEVHPMVAWSYAYQACRKGQWEEYARDRCRFKSRVECCGREIEKVLNQAHRSKVFKERFEEFVSH